METPPCEKSIKGYLHYFLWKIGFIIYVLTSAIPMIGFIVCLFIIAIIREASILICIVMMAMLNPVVTLAIGTFFQTIGKLITRLSPQVFKFKIIARIFTYSINVHFAMIAAVTIHMYLRWLDLGIAAGFEFSNQLYDKCTCKVLTRFNHTLEECVNFEAEQSFQDHFLNIPVFTLLLALVITSLCCHLVQSIVFQMPAPVQLTYFILGEKHTLQEDKTEETGSLIEMKNLEGNLKHEVNNKPNGLKWKQVLSCILGLVFIVGLVCMPIYGFPIFYEGSTGSTNGIVLEST